jgi:hypothetical protein
MYLYSNHHIVSQALPEESGTESLEAMDDKIFGNSCTTLK